MAISPFYESAFIYIEAPGHADIVIVDMVMIVPEINCMESEVVVAEREVLDSASAIEIIVTGRKGGVI